MATANMSYIRQYGPPRINSNTGTPSPFSPPMSGNFSPPPLDRDQFSSFSSQSTLVSTSSTVRSGTPQVDNIVNRRGGVNSSLYQSCLALRRRLAEVPGFEPYLQEMDQEERDADDATDPVTSMWNMLRRGFPLMTIYNALQPRVKLEVNQSKVTESNLTKAATFKFLQACLEELKFPPNECFLITDLYGQDTTGFVKVLKVINSVLDVLAERGMLLTKNDQPDSEDAEAQPRSSSYQQKVIDELVSTERDYVQHLETLQQFKNQLEQSGAIPGDVVHHIFMNLNALLDFQRRFLIRIEQQNSLDPSLQNWGQLFIQYQDGFKVYEPFIANQNRCNEIVSKEWDKIKSAPLSPAFQGLVETQAVLYGFLMKPFQRLTKYPMLLKDMNKKGTVSEEKVRDLELGAEATSSILDNANAAIDREERAVAVGDLLSSVDDWKGHKIDHFGELLLFGSHTVLKGEGQKEVEREYKIYLFEKILLCCNEINMNKPKNRLGNRGNTDKKGKPRLQLKGRIFLLNVTDIMSFTKNGANYFQIFWKGDPGVENFVIRFANEELRNKWRAKVESQRRILIDSARTATSETEFTYMRTQAVLQNPYEEDEDDENDDGISAPMHDLSTSRSASSTSLRSRSTPGGSGSLANRVPPPRFPLPEMPLKVTTNLTAPPLTPDEQAKQSYFSPTTESPVSMRSSQTGMFPFPRQPPTNNGWMPADGNKHNTAPPMGRTPTRDEDLAANGYSMNGRTIQRPSLPAMAANQSVQQSIAQSRLRSASSPDIQNPNGPGGRRYINGQTQPSTDEVPVPPIPTHIASMRAPVVRSQTNSPTDSQRNARAATQSPNLSRGPGGFPSQYNYEQQGVRSDTRYHSQPPSQMSGMGQRIMSPPLPSTAAQTDQAPYVSQLKVKIWFEPRPSHVTIVVPIIIKHRSLIDRIDSKMEKVTSSSIAKGTARLRYLDSEDELITITNDEDVQLAIEEWVINNENDLRAGVIPDFELYWHEIQGNMAM